MFSRMHQVIISTTNLEPTSLLPNFLLQVAGFSLLSVDLYLFFMFYLLLFLIPPQRYGLFWFSSSPETHNKIFNVHRKRFSLFSLYLNQDRKSLCQVFFFPHLCYCFIFLQQFNLFHRVFSKVEMMSLRSFILICNGQ